MRKVSKKRQDAHDKLDDYIDFLVDLEDIDLFSRTDGTDGWVLSVDQRANEAARFERKVE